MTIPGVLVVEGTVIKVKFINAKDKEVVSIISEANMAKFIFDRKKDRLAELAGMAVDLEIENGQPRRVRPQGESWQSNDVDRQQKSIQNTRAGNNRDRQPSQNNSEPLVASLPGDFHNPYNFIPALPRNLKDINSELGDRKPVGHDRYLPEHWSGSIRVKLTTKTPLLIPDAFQVSEKNDHKTFPLRMLNGKPYLPPTSIKGMLRSAYEAVTNSRLSVFTGHDDRLVYRMPAQIGIEMVPVRIENGKIALYTGFSNIKLNGRPDGAMYAAWLPMYDRNSTQVATRAVTFPDGSLPQHRQKVNAWIELYEKTATKDGRENVIFSYWRVREIVPAEQSLKNQQPARGQDSRNHRSTGEYIQVSGFVCITNKNIDGKHDERVFFSDRQPEPIDITQELRTKWQQLITNYQMIHRAEINSGSNSPPALNYSTWSRHITGDEGELKLSDGTLCYAHIRNKNLQQIKILNLYPVMIARSLFDLVPADLLDRSLQPATEEDELSPADRVFGWVNQNGTGAYRGNLRIYDVQCITSNPTQSLGEQGLPLAILGQPKPQQGRFYAAKDNQGTPVDDGIGKQELYQPGCGLRGRKVYPHHQSLPSNHWDKPWEDRTQQSNSGTFQEYRRPKFKNDQVDRRPKLKNDENDKVDRDNQNRSITEWVKPDVAFEFSIEITNLSSVELGALLWLLTLPENHYHRLGGGKPFGFGSVTLAVDETKTDLRTGKEWQTYYSSLLTPPTPANFDLSIPIAAFEQVVTAAYGSKFSEVSFIKAFCQAARGFDDGKPIHYPRITPNPTPDGESFKWFTENEKNKTPRQYPLDSLIADRGLPRWHQIT